MAVIGWDIGGVNTKVARVEEGIVRASLSRPFEVQRDPAALTPLLTDLVREIGASPSDRHAVTMTAELSQMFRTKRDGVAFVLDAVTAAVGDSDVRVYTVDDRFLAPSRARDEPLAVAASNWAATVRVVASDHPHAVLIDIGTTTTDIIPIVDGRVASRGTTDPGRLANGELVYSGALRTPVEAIVHAVPVGPDTLGVSAESFALIGDVYVWRGELAVEDYSVDTPDRRPATREFARERIARVVCADRELLDDSEITAVADAQAARIARAVRRVRARHRSLGLAVVTGLGAFVVERAARMAGLTPTRLADAIGPSAARSAPAAAVALLLERSLHPVSTANGSLARPDPNDEASIDVLVKIGGGLLAHPAHLRSTIDRLVDASREVRLAVIPGGGPFADAVRTADARIGLPDDTAHWMAILAMDQYAHLLASIHASLSLAESPSRIDAVLADGRVPVIAPFRWLRDADPLPHSWDATSDSISAWVAGEVRAKRLVLVKPPGVGSPNSVDPLFAAVVPNQLRWSVIAGDSVDELRSVIVGGGAPAP